MAATYSAQPLSFGATAQPSFSHAQASPRPVQYTSTLGTGLSTASPYSTNHFAPPVATPSTHYTSVAYSPPNTSHVKGHSVADRQGISPMSVEGDRRCVKSVILNEEVIGDVPQDGVRYVEVPYVEEVIRHVPRKEVVEIEKRVPKIEVEYVERVVEVPQIQYVDKQVEVPQVQQVIKHVARKEIVEVPREVIRHVPKVETKVVEKTVEVHGGIIEVPKPYTVENKVMIPQHIDVEVPMMVAQTIRPVLSESTDVLEVDVMQYEPEMIPIDIHVPRSVKTEIMSVGMVEEHHRVVRVPPAQYNSMLRMLNPHILEKDASALPYIPGMNGAVSFLPASSKVASVAPLQGVHIEGWTQRQQVHQHSVAPPVWSEFGAHESQSSRSSSKMQTKDRSKKTDKKHDKHHTPKHTAHKQRK